MSYIPNIISGSRGISALVMLLFPAFSGPFWILYCWGGFSDMIDGTLARKMNATSELGSYSPRGYIREIFDVFRSSPSFCHQGV